MATRILTRRQVLALGAATALGSLFARGAAQAPGETLLRIGTVLPSRTGEGTVRSSINDFTGEGARMGALLAADRVGDEAQQRGIHLDVLLANAPSVAAAERSARRLVSREEISVLVGGVGSGQAAVLAAIAHDSGIPFLNVGATDDDLRRDACASSTYHVEASGVMYLDAIVAWQASLGRRRWFVVAQDGAWGTSLAERFEEALATHGAGGTVVERRFVAHEQPTYLFEINRIARTDADVVLLILDAADQIAFTGQLDVAADEVAVAAFPDPITQTRDFMAASQFLAPEASPQFRVALWDTADREGAEGAMNALFTSRWGVPMDPTAWSAYQAIKMVASAVFARGSADPAAIRAHFDDPSTRFDVAKTAHASFRPSDRQLLQPLKVVEVDPTATWDPLSLQSRVGYGRVVETWPGRDDEVALERLGDGLGAACTP
jgi:branched-chain amino acid transport system substrate-binding protein